MNTEIQPDLLLQKLRLPEEDLSVLSFCHSNKPAAVASWVSNLRAMQVEKTSILFYNALPEVNRLKTSASTRLEMLEYLRPYVQQCIQGLAKSFLNQSLAMEEKKMKTAVVTQAMQKYMINGYLQVVRELAGKYKPGKTSDQKLELACHRAISGCGLMLQRSFQLYTPIPAGLWIELHSVYQLTELFGISNVSVSDDLLAYAPACSIYQAYLRALLLASARPNQMRQTEVSATYDVLEDWVQLAKLNTNANPKPENLFLVNLLDDLGPQYKSRFTGAREQDVRELDLSQLITAIERQQEQSDSSHTLIKIPNSISPALISHLSNAWSLTQQRSFDRQPSKAAIDVCVGITSFHQQITRGQSFEDFLGHEEEEIEEIEMSADPWATDFGSSSNAASEDSLPMHSVRVADQSPGGYCLEWQEKIPAQVKAGEILGLREKGRHRWGLGVIRWIQQQRSSTRLGIQLLAPKTTPYGAAMEQASGEYSDYMRVLLLPELKAANQPTSILTPNLPFKEHQKIQLNHQGEIQEAQLTQRLFSTGSVSQFNFRLTNKPQTETETQDQKAAPSSDQDFSSVWDDK